MNNTYFILRHGETTHQTKKERIVYPWPESSPILLNEKGKKQIKDAAEKLKAEKIDLIFSSDFPRTRQTAEIVAEKLRKNVIFDRRLREFNVGVFRGKEAKQYYNYFSSPKQRFWKTPPKGENFRNCQKRMFDFLKEVDKKHKNKKILIVSHGDPLWLLEGKVKQWKEDELLKQKFQNKSIKMGEIRKLV